MEITEIGLLCIKAETTYGIDPVPTPAANPVRVVGDSLNWNVGSTPVPRRILDATLDRLVGFNAMPNVTLKFRTEASGNRTDGVTADISKGSVANALPIDPILQAANLYPTYTPETSNGARDGNVIYRPKVYTTVGPSVTAYWWTALKLHKLIGGKVNLDKIVCEAGKMVYLDWTIQGKYVAVADDTFSALTPVWTGQEIKPPLFNPSTLVLGSHTNAVVSNLEVELGNTIAQRPDALSDDNLAGFVITDFAPKGRINPESESEAQRDYWAHWKDSTYQLLSMTTGSQSGNKFGIGGTVEFKSVNYADVNKVRVHQVEFDMVKINLTQPIGTQFQLQWS